jgi:hypothetical protein
MVSLAAWPAAGIGQDSGRTATPDELWQDYPLKPGDQAQGGAVTTDRAPREGEAGPARPAGSGTSSQRSEQGSDDEGGGGQMVIVVGLLAIPLLVLLALLVPFEVRRRSRRSRDETTPSGPTWDARRSSAWTAEIRWGSDVSRFRVVASPPAGQEELPVLQSRRLDWPPRSDAAIASLVEAVADLERSVVAAGWEVVEPGGSWFARRFVWPRSDRAPNLTVQMAHTAKEVQQWANRGAG